MDKLCLWFQNVVALPILRKAFWSTMVVRNDANFLEGIAHLETQGFKVVLAAATRNLRSSRLCGRDCPLASSSHMKVLASGIALSHWTSRKELSPEFR
jgi:hypothetical protein